MTTFQIARADGKTLEIQGKMANRHGLIAGATGTGKTVTLRRMAEAFSSEGVPVFLVDVKGDLSGIAQAGANSGKVGERIAEFDLGEHWLQNFPVRFWDVYGETGIPRTRDRFRNRPYAFGPPDESERYARRPAQPRVQSCR